MEMSCSILSKKNSLEFDQRQIKLKQFFDQISETTFLPIAAKFF